MIDEIYDDKLKVLQLKANKARQLVIETLVEAGSGHSAGPLGMADIFTAFYFHILNHDPENPDWTDRDRLILSNGHICPIRYVTMAMAGYFPIEELKTLRKINSRLQGHPHRTALPGVETTSGPLGEGLSQAIGIALAARLDKKNYYTYVLTSDGEHQEGNTWEAALLAGKMKLNNLIQVIDYNNIQIDGNVVDVMPLESMKAKYESFNWHVIEVAGNDIKAFISAIQEAHGIHDKPIFIFARTIPGKDVSFMENDYRWHGVPPDIQEMKGAPPKGEQAKKALEELMTLQGKIESEHQA
ncbi:MAG: transketolase [Patescibacteria group bacterium]